MKIVVERGKSFSADPSIASAGLVLDPAVALVIIASRHNRWVFRGKGWGPLGAVQSEPAQRSPTLALEPIGGETTPTRHCIAEFACESRTQ